MEKYLREPINSLTHFIGAILSVFALIAMLVKGFINNSSTVTIASVIIFGISLILLYTVSATYHGVITSDKVIFRLRKLDHSMIFILIAGSYAPFSLIALGGSRGTIFFTIIASIAISGILFRMLWFNCPRWLQTALYIGLGWAAIFMIKPLSQVLSPISLFLLVLGGVLYTVGGVIYGLKPKKLQLGKFGFHEIFHIFIILGSLCHFICVFIYLI
ncbi:MULTISPECIES: PAQR family membrane homeostasis protein TrhA [unclassified Clostridium]|uniref:PAQR family membrane homeostasis protein TrhA n=1 Tax=unclassified Clostridium TaxID=2614128 RepID=UPI0029085CB3|nr:hemolysin III family protein [Clostridium sp.]MDU5105701.1 hemolysin III family protein [Clostridium sp.]